MNKIKLIIADENQEYARGLALFLQQEYMQLFELVCFTQEIMLQEYLAKGESVDILLIDYKLLSKGYSEAKIKAIAILSDSKTESYNGAAIYKYQKADKIAKLILELYDKNSDCNIHAIRAGKAGKLICIYSPSGSSGKTTVACNLAQQYAFHAKRVLLLSLEAYTSIPLFKAKEDGKGITYFLYLLKNRLPNLQLKLDAIKEKDNESGIDFIQRESNALEYKDIKIEDIELLADYFKHQSGYDAVVIDLDSTISEVVLGCFKFCDNIINVQCLELCALNKLQDFNMQLPKISKLIDVDISSKLINVRNKGSYESYDIDNVGSVSAAKCSIPLIKGDYADLGFNFPEAACFKQLYDVLETAAINRGDNND